MAIFICSLHLNGQTEPPKKNVDNDYDMFKGLFENQFQSETSTNAPKKVSTRKGNFTPVVLPLWFCEGWRDQTGQTIGVGISDPGMDSVQAFEQAYARALAMLALSGNYQIENVLDNYYLDKETKKTLGKFNSFTSIFADKSFNQAKIIILEQEYNTNQEAMVLIGLTTDWPPSDDCDRVRILIENFESELTRSKKPVVIGKSKSWLHLEGCSGSKELFEYHRSYSPDGVEIESGTDTLRAVEFDNWFVYKAPEGSDSASASQSFPQYFTLKFGLWDAWQSAIITQLEQSDLSNSQVKNLDEQTNSEFQGLIRIIFRGENNFRIKRAVVKDNKLLLEFN